ncbi:transcription factor TFIIH associated cyclin-dependent protein kinase Mcs6 [Schizosaccharomyces osmophilus]|uniref:[RNA-polymerase]-subunit kinase n=2 Tax=Schizosaccharomyces TaxID=4895 RepID=S9R1T0_SCHOY|nr:CMGC/CDK/CDK7 protein kinase Mcs6 [Schizosaccharomyces octosporus yFS286]XP_056036070.1 transcription factor TFIIH associated cyclin-dependent protein kinase Mcs6 [Schizosaccharomyces osmophilus]EPX72375.1 CMGC/CDK/CDK7 protein kinase Mcs6 [Schizosaccharomyces octosporus yFS286]WBW71827.1 transcription factor TFIIH associated cyclin-dependent protein kinase Mcs6 [Schizosaccharomyces osmophilus]
MDIEKSTKWSYVKERKVGEGTYAVVFLGRQKETNRRVAIKKIKVGQFKDGIDLSALREIKFLKETRHVNVIELMDVFATKSNLNIILEFLDSDLEMLIKDKFIVFQPAHIKAWMLMLLRGLHHIHSRFILHRDLKPNNLLISSDGVLKLADFGLSRDYGMPNHMSHQVITRWYRPPELFMGCRSYGTGVDMWSVGCIFAELMLRTPYLPGETDLDQLSVIFRALGSPEPAVLQRMKQLPNYVDMKAIPPPSGGMEALFSAAGTEELDLLKKFFDYDPYSRPTAQQALEHPYFSCLPRPTHPSELPKKGGEEGIKHVSSDLQRQVNNSVRPNIKFVS